MKLYLVVCVFALVAYTCNALPFFNQQASQESETSMKQYAKDYLASIKNGKNMFAEAKEQDIPERTAYRIDVKNLKAMLESKAEKQTLQTGQYGYQISEVKQQAPNPWQYGHQISEAKQQAPNPWQNSEAKQQVPGGYGTGRHLDSNNRVKIAGLYDEMQNMKNKMIEMGNAHKETYVLHGNAAKSSDKYQELANMLARKEAKGNIYMGDVHQQGMLQGEAEDAIKKAMLYGGAAEKKARAHVYKFGALGSVMHKVHELNDKDVAKAATFVNYLNGETAGAQVHAAASTGSASRLKALLAREMMNMKEEKLMAMDQFLSSI